MILKFCGIINLEKKYMNFSEFKNKLDIAIEAYTDFEITQKGSDYVWIGKRNKFIGNWTCHYEIKKENKKIYADIHFERFNKTDFLNLCKAYYESTPRHNKGVRLSPQGFDIEEKSIKKCFDLFIQADNKIGEELEKLEQQIYDERINNLVNQYRDLLISNPNKAIKGELYKWDLIEKTKQLDTIGLINEVKKSNLIYGSNVNIMYNNLLLKDTDTAARTKEVIDYLLDENVDIYERFKTYQEGLKSLCEEKNYEICVNDERTAISFLTCRYPNKYTFFKPKAYESLCNYFIITKKQGFERVNHYLAIIDDIAGKLLQDDVIVSEIKKYLAESNLYPKLLAQTLLWVCLPDEEEDWIPTDYIPNISQDEWNELVQNRSIFREESLITFACILNAKSPTCTEMAEEYGRDKEFYNQGVWRTGERIYKKTGCELFVGESDKDRFWPVCCLGKKLKNGFWAYKIRPELLQAFETTKVLQGITLKEGDDKMSKAKELSTLLKRTHNLILHGAPGTGKTHLARDIAKELGASGDSICFVQFHPSYDYTDFVEGLRPVVGDNEKIEFEKKDGIFKAFCIKALETENEDNFDEAFDSMLNDILENGNIKELETPSKAKFRVSVNQRRNLTFFTGPDNRVGGSLTRKGVKTEFEGKPFYKYWLGYYQGVIKYLESEYQLHKEKKQGKESFVFIIDEINRGDLSKIFGELFYSIDPGYRIDVSNIKPDNPPATILTQYSNMDIEPNDFDLVLGEKKQFGHFFIPDNVYIIGTMNDIDRSVESMDFAFRRRFTFKEIKAVDTQETILKELEDSIRQKAINRMNSLNGEITKTEGLSTAYHIGAAYFLKLKELDNNFGLLWEYHLEPLLNEYLRGQGDIESKMKALKEAYDKE